MRVTLDKKWGDHPVGEVVDVTDIEGKWLVDLGIGSAKGHQSPIQAARAPGSNGEDPLAGGDPTRRYGMVSVKGERTHNDALPVPGSPVQYNMGVRDTPVPTGKANNDDDGPADRPKTATRARKSS